MTDPKAPSAADEVEAELLAHDLDTALDVVAAAWLEPMTPNPELLARIQRTVAEPPLRYAPFYERIAELFDLPQAAIERELTRLATPSVWRFAGLPGVHNVVVQAGPRTTGAETVFARFAPGTRFPRHRHTGLETVLVLEGEYEDSVGVTHRAGELRSWQPGTNHGFRVSTDGPCIIASVVYGREFEAAPLRWLARALGR